MKRLTMIGMAALLLMAASCKKDKEQDIENAGSGFRATVENPTSGNKTHLVNGTAVHWNSGDQILIANSSSNPVTMTFATTSNDATATFTATDDLPAGFYTAPYTAYYPAGAFSGSTLTLGGTQTATIVADAKGHYEPTFGIGANPMISNSTTTELAFKNICGLLQLQLYSQSSCTVSSITITSADNLCGTGTVAWNDGEPTFEITSNGSNSVTLNCGTGVALSTAPTSFYIALPAGTLASGFSVTVTASNGDTWEASTTKNNHIERSKITPMPAKEVICTPTVSVESVTLNTASLSLNVSATEQLTATVLPEGANQNVTWTSSNTDFATVDETGLVTAIAAGTTTITATSVADNTKSASCIVTVTVPVPDGALPGVFTINEDGRQVYFSKGNLYYNGEEGSKFNSNLSAGWNFYDKQTDFCNESSVSASNEISLFTWGYGTWSKEYTNYNYETSDVITDWGTQIGDGNWRTLTSDQWNYLYNVRGGTGYPRFARARITVSSTNIYGLLIFPDGYSGRTSGNGISDLNKTDSGGAYPTTSMTESEWKDLEDLGVVFLPAAGWRNKSKTVTYPNAKGYYSSSDPSGTNCKQFVFDNANISTSASYRYLSRAVRLVKDVPNRFNGGNANDFDPATW